MHVSEQVDSDKTRREQNIIEHQWGVADLEIGMIAGALTLVQAQDTELKIGIQKMVVSSVGVKYLLKMGFIQECLHNEQESMSGIRHRCWI
jgi:hypothetical protein